MIALQVSLTILPTVDCPTPKRVESVWNSILVSQFPNRDSYSLLNSNWQPKTSDFLSQIRTKITTLFVESFSGHP